MKFKATIVAVLIAAGLAMPGHAQDTMAPRAAPDLGAICGAEGCMWEKVATCDGFIEGINFDSDGQLWMVGYFSGALLRVEGDTCVTVGTPQPGPNGAKFSPSGDFVSADNNAGLTKFDLETGERTILYDTVDGEKLDGLNDLAFDPAGGLYVTRPRGSDFLNPTGKVFYVSPEEGAVPELFHDGLIYPNGIAISANGERAYIAEFAANRIISVPTPLTKNPYDPVHVLARFSGGTGPDGLTVDAAGNIYVAHFLAGEVIVLDVNGIAYGTIRLPEGAGLWTTNLSIHNSYLYVTEAMKNEVWRVALNGDAVK
ncbi:MAG: SMP-30/gluconolactonase/LRE family protein [Sulfitobacter sp.]